MQPKNRNVREDRRPMRRNAISRRQILGASGAAVVSLACGSAYSRQGLRGNDARRGEMDERMRESRVFSERMRSASSMAERLKIMEERRAQERIRAIASFQEELGISEKEWTVVKPRLERVYDLVHPRRQMGFAGGRDPDPVERRRRELREVLGNPEAAADEIKAGLTALRTARERASQELAKARYALRQVLTLRQEAQLVVDGLLD